MQVLNESNIFVATRPSKIYPDNEENLQKKKKKWFFLRAAKHLWQRISVIFYFSVLIFTIQSTVKPIILIADFTLEDLCKTP